MKYKELIDAIINEQANDAKTFVTTSLSEKIEVEVDSYANYVTESLFGLEKTSVEVTEENFEELLNALSEEDTKALEEELTALEAEGLSEEELSEISLKRLGQYVNKASADGNKKLKDGNIVKAKSRHNNINKAIDKTDKVVAKG